MELLQAVFLGLLQGVTEWLPVSSSGHLALAQYALGLEVPVAFDVMLHFATLVAVTAFFRRDIAAMLRGFSKGELRYPALLAVALVPTAIIGIGFKGFFESMYSQPKLVAIALAITGVFLLLAEKFASGKNALSPRLALAIGLAQGIAVAPGISRSGATIGTGMLCGIKREEAAKFSFILAIPAIAGATALEGVKAFSLAGIGLAEIAAGMLAAGIAGYLSIGALMRVLNTGGLKYFAAYCLAVAALVFFLF